MSGRVYRDAVNRLARRASPSFVRAFSTTQASASSESQVPKVIVLGGRGYVGSAVCKELVASGLRVVAISRSGTSPMTNESWANEVSWVRGNALEAQTYSSTLQGAAAVISCVGGFGNQEEMRRTCGTANVEAVSAALAAGVPRFVFISATVPDLPGLSYILGGYIQGKKDAEEALFKSYPTGGVALRPGFIYGDRVVSSSLTLPLGLVGRPMESILSQSPMNKLATLPYVGGLFVPPVSLQTVAKAAVAAATDPSSTSGVWSVDDIQKYK
jgi:uncharacterized protein YbjT (DUF2867 family)